MYIHHCLIPGRLVLIVSVVLPATSSIQSCWILVSITSCTLVLRKIPTTGSSSYLQNSVNLSFTELRSREVLYIPTMYYGSGPPVGKIPLQARHRLTGFTDTRLYNFTVYDDAGSALVAMTGFELKRNLVSSPLGVRRRYEIALQPITSSAALPRVAQWTRPDKETANLMMNIADHEAQSLLRRTLDRGVTIGDDPHRQRYYQFAKEAAARNLPPLPSSPIVEGIKVKWPIVFQIIDRLSHVHRDVFETSAVSLLKSRHHHILLTFGIIPGNCPSLILR